MSEPAGTRRPADRYPIMVDLRARACLVVGGGRVADRKTRSLLDAGAEVTVIAPDLSLASATAERVTWLRRPYRSGDAASPRWWFVVAATDDPAVNTEVVADGISAGTWVNDASAAEGGPAALPAVHRRPPVTVTVSTGGTVPGAAAWLRDELAMAVTPEHLRIVEIMAELRARHRGDIRSGWKTVVDSGMLEMIREGREAEVKERLEACLSSSSD